MLKINTIKFVPTIIDISKTKLSNYKHVRHIPLFEDWKKINDGKELLVWLIEVTSMLNSVLEANLTTYCIDYSYLYSGILLIGTNDDEIVANMDEIHLDSDLN